VPTALLTIDHPELGPDRLAERLRSGSPPVIARVADGRVVVDLRTVDPGEEEALLEAISRATA